MSTILIADGGAAAKRQNYWQSNVTFSKQINKIRVCLC